MLNQYSHSALNCFRTCPMQFRFRYVDKIKIPRRVSADAYLGNAVHRVLKPVYEWAADGKLYPLDRLLQVYKTEWDKPERKDIEVSAEHMTVDDYIENGKKMITEYYEQYKPFDHDILLGAELKRYFTLPGTPFKFNAIIDRLSKRSDGTVEIADYKTGRLSQGVQDPAFKRQMGLYQLAVQAAYPQFEEIEVSQYFLKYGEAIRHRLTPDEIDEISEQIRQDVVATINAERLDDFPAKEGPLCNYCDYQHLCPAKRHRLLLEAESESDGDNQKETALSAAELTDRYIEADREEKSWKQEKDALRRDIISAARDLNLSKLSGHKGDLSLSHKRDEKLPSKSKAREQFETLSCLLRDWGFEDYFELNGNEFMKQVYRKGILKPEQLEQLAPFVSEDDSYRFRIQRRHEEDESSED